MALTKQVNIYSEPVCQAFLLGHPKMKQLGLVLEELTVSCLSFGELHLGPKVSRGCMSTSSGKGSYIQFFKKSKTITTIFPHTPPRAPDLS